MKDHSSFFEKKNGWWGDPFYLRFWAKLAPLERKRRFQSIFARSASAVTPSEKSSVNEVHSRFPMSL